MYERKYDGGHREERILVICSFSSEEFSYRLPRGYNASEAELLLDNYIPEGEPAAEAGAPGRLKPYEAQVWKF